jgi:hypothetical protein
MRLCGVFLLILSACSAKGPAHDPTDETFFLSEARAAQLPAPELVRRYVTDYDPAALALSSRGCPAHSARVDSLVTGLLNLPTAQERTRDFALYWSKLIPTCEDQRIHAWYRTAIARPGDDLTIVLLTNALLRTGDSSSARAVKLAAFDTANHTDVRDAILTLFVEGLNLSGEQRLELMIESYRQTGEIPGNFAANQASLTWLQQTPNWREALLTELIAAPGKRGAPPLLLTLAKETRNSPSGSRWRRKWEQALETLQTHPDASADVKSMLPIAREVARSGQD